MSENPRKNWSQRLAEARLLKSKGMSALHGRIKILVTVYEDTEFRSNCEDRGVDEIEQLDLEVNDICGGSFMKLKAVIEHFPQREQWGGGNLEQMIAQVLESQKKDRKGRTYEGVSWKKKYHELEEKYNAVLSDNTRLLGRIEELERLLDKFMAGTPA